VSVLDRIGSLTRRLEKRVGRSLGNCRQCGKATRSHIVANGVECHSCRDSPALTDGGSPNWQAVFDDARAGSLGTGDDDPVAKGALVAELRSRGFVTRTLDRAVDNGILEIAEQGVPPKYEISSTEDIAESGSSKYEVLNEQSDEEKHETPDRLDLSKRPEYEEDVYLEDAKQTNQWLNWSYDQDRKIPRAPWRSGDKFVSAQDPKNWTDFQTAREYADMLPGFEFAFNLADEGEGWRCVFVDLDDVRDPESGDLHPVARDLVERAGSFAQVSTSGTGLHIFVDGTLPDGVESIEDSLPDHNTFPDAEIEVYDKARFVGMTGYHLVETPTCLVENQEFVDELAEEYISHAEGTPDEMRSEPELSREEVLDVETTDDIEEVFDAVQHVSPSDITLRSEVTHERSSREKDLNPSWTTSKSGTRLGQVGDGWVYRKGMVGLDALQVVALEEGIIHNVNQYPEGDEFWQAVDALRERGAHIPKYEPPEDSGSKPVAAIPNTVLDELTPEEAKRYARRRDVDYVTTEDLRDRLEDELVEAMEAGGYSVIDAPTGAGKSHLVSATEWTTRQDETDGQPVVHLHATHDARDEAHDRSQEHDVRSKRLLGYKEACPVCSGDYDPENVDEADDALTIDGEPISDWFERQVEMKGIPVSVAHKQAQMILGDSLPCETCKTQTQWQHVPRHDEDSDQVVYDVIHATHEFAHVPSLRYGCHIIFDEEPDFELELGQDRLRRAVTAYLSQTDAEIDTFEELVEGDYDDVRDHLDEEPPREWYFETRDAHVLAPALTKALFYAVDAETDENGRSQAVVPFEPPRLDAGANEDDGWNRVWLRMVVDEDNNVRRMWQSPDFTPSGSVTGMDAHPSTPVWQLNVHPGIEVREILNAEERAWWRRCERGLHVVQVGEATRPLSTGEYYDSRGSRCILEHLRDEYDGFSTGITTKAVEDEMRENMEKVSIGEPRMMHFGEEKSRNDFDDEDVGYVEGCVDPGDGYVLDLVAALELDATPETKECPECEGSQNRTGGDFWCSTCKNRGEVRVHGRGFEGGDDETADAILASVRENHVAQAVGRYARNPDDPDDNAVVYVRTDAAPAEMVDTQVPGVVWTYGDKQRDIVEYARDNPGVTAREISESTGASKQHVSETLSRLVENGDATVREGVAEHGADAYWVDSGGGLGVAELESEDIANSDVWDNYTWELTVSRLQNNQAGHAESTSRPDGGETSSQPATEGDSPPD
jgi:hypothetical protein